MTRHLKTQLKRVAFLFAVVLSSASLFPDDAISASDGSLGTDSTGSVDITVTKPVQAKISGMTDMTIASWVIGDGDKALHTDVCIYTTSGDYTVVATGSGASQAFTLTDGVGSGTLHVTPYTVKWDDAGVGAIGVGAGTSLTAANTPAAFSNASVDSADCTGGVAPGKNARINISLLGADLLKLASGTFTGTLTLLVAPD